MRETLVYLTHLNYDDTESIMLDKLALQVDGTEWSWANLNTLCWAVGSISGAMSEDEEKRFLVTVIKDLLGLCEVKRGKGNKACIASNIMYVVGQYPRFLRAHWKFLKTVVNKLFEFMHELHPGVQDMACDTFLKIAQKCKRKFVTQQPAEPRPFVQDLVAQLPQIISDLEPHQVHAFYEATATLLSDRGGHPSVGQQRPELLRRLMTLPNDAWARVTADAARDPSTLTRPETVRDVTKIVRTHARVCASCGPLYVTQLGGIYMDLLNARCGVSSFRCDASAVCGARWRLWRPSSRVASMASGATHTPSPRPHTHSKRAGAPWSSTSTFMWIRTTAGPTTAWSPVLGELLSRSPRRPTPSRRYSLVMRKSYNLLRFRLSRPNCCFPPFPEPSFRFFSPFSLDFFFCPIR